MARWNNPNPPKYKKKMIMNVYPVVNRNEEGSMIMIEVVAFRARWQDVTVNARSSWTLTKYSDRWRITAELGDIFLNPSQSVIGINR